MARSPALKAASDPDGRGKVVVAHPPNPDDR